MTNTQAVPTAELLHFVVETEGIAVWTYAAEQRLFSGDVRACEMHGVGGDFNGSLAAVLRRVVRADRRDVVSAFRRCMAQGDPCQVAYRTPDENGGQRWVSCRARLVETSQGVVWRGICRDVTLEVEERKHLTRGLAQIATMFDDSPEALALVGADGRCVRANHQLKVLLHGDREPLRVALLDGIGSPGDIVDLARRSAETGTQSIAMIAETPSGRRPVSIRAYRADSASATQFLLAVRDDTKCSPLETIWRQKSELMRELNARLVRTAQLRDEFLGGMSHELRTPLASILGVSEALAEGVYGPIDERVRRGANAIYHSALSLLSRISDILDLANADAGRLTLEPAPTVLADLCESSLSAVRQRAAERQVTFRVALDARATRLDADAGLLRRAVVCLLDNAIKFSTPRSEILLEVVTEDDSETLTFTVVGQGPGLPIANHSEIFEALVQLHERPGGPHSGTGLGFALAHRLVRLHGGGIGAADGPGSRFFLKVPVRQPSTAVRDPHVEYLGSMVRPAAPLDVCDGIVAVFDEPSDIDTVVASFRGVVSQVPSWTVARPPQLTALAGVPALVVLSAGSSLRESTDTIRSVRRWPRWGHVPIILVNDILTSYAHTEYMTAGATAVLDRPLTSVRVRRALDAAGLQLL